MSRAAKHFKIHCSIGNHRKTAAMALDNDMLALYVRLGMLAVDRFADKTGDELIVRDRELLDLTGKRRADVARKSLEHLANITPISAERQGEVWRIKLPNFAKKQGFGARNKSGIRNPPTPTPTPTPKEKIKRNKRATEGPKKRSTLCPESFTAEERESIDLWNAKRPPADQFSREELSYAFEMMYTKSHARGTLKNVNWPLAFKGYLKSGWVLDGFKAKKTSGRDDQFALELAKANSGEDGF